MPSLANFMESLTQEQDKLVMMGTMKPSKDQALVAGDYGKGLISTITMSIVVPQAIGSFLCNT